MFWVPITQDYGAGHVIRTDAQCAASGCTKGAANCNIGCNWGLCINLPGCQATCSSNCVWGCSYCGSNCAGHCVNYGAAKVFTFIYD